MDVKEAVRAAKASVLELFREQIASDPLLEEVEFDDGNSLWQITLSFIRIEHMLETVDEGSRDPFRMSFPLTPRRAYKLVSIRDGAGNVVSVKDRELP